MADPGLDDAEPPRRRRRGPPPRLYVIAPRTPFPWLRVRRLVAADRAALAAHLGRQMAQMRPQLRGALDEAGIAALCAGLDFTRLVAFGAIAGNAVVATACGMPGRHGPELAMTEDAAYRDRDLGRMLASQVQGAGLALPAPDAAPDAAEQELLQLLRSCGDALGPPAVALAQTA